MPLPQVALHTPATIPYVSIAAVAYIADRTLRILLKTRLRTATITAVPEMRLTQLNVPALSAGWRAGQHVRVRVLSSAMGTMGWTESTPCTIATAAGSQEGLTLFVPEGSGGTARRLYMLALAASLEKGAGAVRVLVEGPYGASFLDVWLARDGALMERHT